MKEKEKIKNWVNYYTDEDDPWFFRHPIACRIVFSVICPIVMAVAGVLLTKWLLL